MTIEQLIERYIAKSISFELDGENLKIHATPGALTADVISELKQNKPDIIAWLKRQENNVITRREANMVDIPLSFAQQRLWFIDVFEQGSAHYNIPAAFKVTGQFDCNVAQQALVNIIQRHESLRTVFVEKDSMPVQIIQEQFDFKLNVVDLSLLDETTRQQRLNALILQNAQQPVDLSKDLMIRASWLLLEQNKAQPQGVLLFNIHHIASDGWSMALLAKEFVAQYQAILEGNDSGLAQLSIQYADYGLWQKEQISDTLFDKQLNYWSEQLRDIPPLHNLTLDYQRPVEKQSQGEKVKGAFSRQQTQQIQALATKLGLTPFMLLHSVLALVLSRHSDSKDIVIGTPVANRTRVELESLIGFFVNTLVLRTNTNFTSLSDYFKHVKTVNLDAQANQDVPFEQLVDHCKVPRSTAHTPLFQVNFSLNNNQTSNLSLQGLTFVPLESLETVAKFDLQVDANIVDDVLELIWIYDVALFSSQRIKNLSQHFINLLEAIVANPTAQIDSLNMMSVAENQRLIHDLNNTEKQHNEQANFLTLFEQQVNRDPQLLAVYCGQQQLSYQQLNQKANQLAHYLKDNGVTLGTMVGICLDRSIDMMVALIAVFKAGGAYVALDAQHPKARVEHIIEDTKLNVLLTHQGVTEHLQLEQSICVLALDDSRIKAAIAAQPNTTVQTPQGFDSSALAYVLYTSGSTGRPKGVLVPHHALANYLHFARVQYLSDQTVGSVVSSPLVFDATITTLLPPLLCGKSVMMLPDSDSMISSLSELLNDDVPRLFKLTPAHLEGLGYHQNSQTPVATRHCIVVGGEQLNVSTLLNVKQDWLQQSVFINEYGPTETVVGCSIYTIDSEQDINALQGKNSVPIGKPIANTRLFVLSQDGQLMPDNTAGELYIGGSGVTDGYLNLAQMTEARFIPSPFDQSGKERLYRTGDKVCRLADGNLMFLGRFDEQVKIRGFRIELGEIEHHLAACTGVASSLVMVPQHADELQRLVGYVVKTSDCELEHDTLKQQITSSLEAQLPVYMVPSAIVILTQWPLTANGKIDRKALPSADGVISQGKYIAPVSEAEKQLVEIWAELLKKDPLKLSVEANFFELGGDSILSIQVVSRAARIGLHFNVKDLFVAQSIRRLAARTKAGNVICAPQYAIEGEMSLLPIQHQFFSDLTQLHHYNQSVMLTTPQGFDTQALTAIVESLYQRHDALRLAYTNHLGRWSAHHLPFNEQMLQQAYLTHHIDDDNFDSIEGFCDQVQASMDPLKGQLFKAAYISCNQGAGRLLLAIHHLAVDGVSWRILLEDIELLYGQYIAGQPLKTAAKTSAYAQWGEFLAEYAHSQTIQHERTFWLDRFATEINPLQPYLAASVGQSQQVCSTQFSLNEVQTEQLLSESHKSYRTQINELLLTGVLIGCHRSTGVNGIRLDLEGHGREPLSDSLDLSETLGWFTHIYPITLKISAEQSLQDIICAVKEDYRAIPAKGIGFGILRQLAQDSEFSALPASEIVFNYLGQFDQVANKQNYFGKAKEPLGRTVSAERDSTHPLLLTGMVIEGKLGFNLSFDSSVYDKNKMQALMDNIALALEQIIDHCLDQTAGRYTPSDFPLATVTQTELDNWINQRPIDALYPATGSQQGMLFHSMMDASSYIIQILATFNQLDVAQFQQAWQMVAQRHNVFRTAFFALDSEHPMQLVLSEVELNWQIFDLTELDSDSQQQRIESIRLTDKTQGFKSSKAPLLRFILIQIADDKHILLWSFHHALLDGWCMPLIFGEVTECYRALSQNQQPTLNPVKSYEDHLRWLSEQSMAEAQQFWTEQLSEIYTPTPLPLVKEQDLQQTGDIDVHMVEMVFTSQQNQQLLNLAKAAQTTLNVVFQGAWSLLLSRYSGEQKVVFGGVTSGRPADLAGVEEMVGLFINSLPIVVDIDNNALVIDWLGQLHQAQIEREHYNYLPLYDIQRQGKIAGATFNSLVIFENQPMDEAIGEKVNKASLQIESIDFFNETNFAISLVVEPGKQLNVRLEVKQHLLTLAQTEQLAKHLQQLLFSMVQSVNLPVSQVSPFDEREIQALLNFNTDTDLPKGMSVHQLFEQQADRTPENVAIRYKKHQLSYLQLNQQANKLARYLLDTGIENGVNIGIFLERSIEMMVAVLAVMKAGGTYVPMEPSHPKARLQLLIDDADIEQVLLTSQLLEHLPSKGVDVLLMDDAGSDELWMNEYEVTNLTDEVQYSDDDLMYVLYTSGSTGRPKGVMVPHRCVINYLHYAAQQYLSEPMAGSVVTSPLVFDATITTLFTPLLTGQSVTMLADSDHLITELAELLESNTPRLFKLTPAHLDALSYSQNATDIVETRHTVVVGGEQLSVPTLLKVKQDWLPQSVFINEYGPTETTVGCSIYTVDSSEDVSALESYRSVPIGKPIANTRLYVLSPEGLLMPHNCAGELYIGGQGVSAGYLNLPQMSEERFIASAFKGHNNEQLYRTGDKVMLMDNGDLMFLGRFDEQVKVRGFRIELGEIEHHLNACNGVSAALALVPPSDEQLNRLIGYVVKDADCETSDSQLRSQISKYLETVLPQYMVPTAIVVLSAWPLTANGKIDRQALPNANSILKDAQYTPPVSQIEKQLVEIWAKLLQQDAAKLSIDHNFFELGGDSILSIQMVSRAAQQGLHISVQDLFVAPTIAQLAKMVKSGVTINAPQMDITGKQPLLPIQQAFFEDLTQWHHYNQSLMLTTPAGFDLNLLKQMIKVIYQRHDALRLVFNIEQPTTQTQVNSHYQPLSEALLERIVSVKKLPQNENLRDFADELQGSLLPQEGLLFKAALIVGQDQPDHLLLVCHHLVIDGVSWRILLEDFETLYNQHNQNQPFKLSAKTSSYQQWSEALLNHGNSELVQQQTDYWLKVAANDIKPLSALAVDTKPGLSYASLTFSLSESRTTQLLNQTNKTYRTHINELLLSALLIGVYQTTDSDTIRIDLEGHGRETLPEPLDLSQTLGWFTSIYPLSLTVAQSRELADIICAVKEDYRQIPTNGIGFGVLKYLTKHPQLINTGPSELLFNYLGQFDQVVDNNNHFVPAQQSSGTEVSPLRKASHPLVINSQVSGGCFSLSLGYDSDLFTQHSMQLLLDNIQQALDSVISHCINTENGRFTPSDFPLFKGDTTELTQWQQSYDIEDIYPATGAQQGMLFHSLLDASAYVNQTVFQLKDTDIDRFKQAWALVIRRHNVFRTAFVGLQSGNPHQLVLKDVSLPWQIHDVTDEDDQLQQFEAIRLADLARGFDTSEAPLTRLTQVAMGNNQYQLIWTVHHALVDGWCMPLVFGEVTECYRALTHGQSPKLEPVQSYRRFASWLAEQDYDAAKQYWSAQVGDIEHKTAMPLLDGKIEMELENSPIEKHYQSFSQQETDAIVQMAKSLQITVNVLVQAAWSLLLSNCSGEQKVVFGAVTSGRPAQLEGVENIVGLFINTLPVVVDIPDDIDIGQWLKSLHLQLAERDSYSFVALSDIQRLASGSDGLFDSLLVFENYPIDEALGEKADDAMMGLNNIKSYTGTNYALSLIAELSQQFSLGFDYKSSLFSAEKIATVAAYMKQLLLNLCDNVLTPVADIDMLSKAAREALINDFKGTQSDYPQDVLIHQLFSEQAQKNPEQVAVVFEQHSINYRKLNARANQLAHCLINKGVGAETLVGVCVEPSTHMLVAILAVLKAGGAYVPMDPTFPQTRLTFMMEDTNSRFLLSEPELIAQLNLPADVEVINIHDASLYDEVNSTDPQIVVAPNNAAYVIYTSGSTGQPKGVIIEHRNLTNYVFGVTERFGIIPNLHYGIMTSIATDLGNTTLFLSLTQAGTAHVIGKQQILDSDYINNYVCQHQLDVLKLTPSHFSALFSLEQLTEFNGSYLILGGEAMDSVTREKVAALQAKGVKIFNHYGPTEATIGCCAMVIDDNTNLDCLPIGQPLPNQQCYVLGRNNRPVPKGVVGHLYVGGQGVARGYLNRKQLTEQSFIANPFDDNDSSRLYNTGDLVKVLPEGNLLFLGRSDEQIKIRGYRVELGEIESCINGLDGVKAALVLAKQNASGQKHLVAYIVVDGQTLQVTDELTTILSAQLQDTMPAHMIPSVFVPLSEFKRLPNGKIDKRALPSELNLSVKGEFVAPTSDNEKMLQAIWAQLLNKDAATLSVNSNFFELGGDSILSIQVVSRAAQVGLYFSVKDLFMTPTIAQLAVVAKSGVMIEAPQQPSTGTMTLLPVHQVMLKDRTDWHHYNQSLMLTVPEGFSLPMLKAIVSHLYQRHDALRLSFGMSDGQWQGNFEPLNDKMLDRAIEVHACEQSQIEQIAAAIQSSLRPEQALNLKAVYLHGDFGGRLLMVIHHLVVDGVSWRVLLEDIQTLHQQWQDNKRLSLAAKTSSYQQWSEFLHEYANSDTLAAEKSYWYACVTDSPISLAQTCQRQFTGQWQQSGFGTADFTLSETATEQLLSQSAQSYRTNVNELLLSGLLLGCIRTFDIHSLRIDMEGHGREMLSDSLDLSQTMGWFTTIYPVLLEYQNEGDIGELICSVKETLRKIPNNGIGFGVLQQLAKDPQLVTVDHSELVFNYLGQFDQVVNQDKAFSVAPESPGQNVSSNRKAKNPLVINGMVSAGQLNFNLTYERAKYPAEAMTQLMNNIQVALNEIISHCVATVQGRFTPSDFPLVNISTQDLQQFQNMGQLVDIFPTTGIQQGLLFHSMLVKGSYVSQTLFTFRALKLAVFKQCWQEVVKRYGTFRTAFVGLDTEHSYQLVFDDAQIPWFYQDLSALDANAQAQKVEQLRSEDKLKGFDFATAPLMRFTILNMGGDVHQLIWSYHHALLDGWCLPLVFNDITHMYKATVEQSVAKLKPISPYRDYIAWLVAQDQQASMDFWQQQLAEVEQSTPLPLVNDTPQNTIQEQGVFVLPWQLSADETAQLTHLVQSAKTTVNILVQAAWALLLSRYSGHDKVVFGAVSSGRPANLPGVEQMVGLFINSLPVVVTVEQNLEVEQWLNILHQQLVEREEHSYLPLSDIQQQSADGQSVFDSIVVFENFPVDDAIKQKVTEATLQIENIESFRTTNYGVSLIAEMHDVLVGRLEVQKHLMSEADIETLIVHFKQLLLGLSQRSQGTVADVQMLTEQQRQFLLEQTNDTDSDYDRDWCVHQLFEAQVALTPDNIAVICGETSLNYQQLNSKANQLANYLIEAGLELGEPVAIYLNRSIEMMIAVLAVMKAGGTYVPLEPGYPLQRSKMIIEDGGIEIVLIEGVLMDSLPVGGVDVLLMDNAATDDQWMEEFSSHQVDIPQSPDAESLAYLLYTSGSTGKPKGVMVPHRGIVNYLHHASEHYLTEQIDGSVVSSPLCFDATVTTVLAPLCVGKSVTLLADDEQLFTTLAGLLFAPQAKLFKLTPAHLEALAYQTSQGQSWDTEHCLVIGGEQLLWQTLLRWHAQYLPKAHYVNEYGPTETVVGCSTFTIGPDIDIEPYKALSGVPIGKPVNNTQLYILDQGLRLMPNNSIGELYIGGDGVTKGYLNLPKMTQERFIASPFAVDKTQGQQLYRTGDSVYRLPDGQLMFVGRIDEQVKIRGFRIELGEIEACLNQLDTVQQATVLAREDEGFERRLVAYVAVDEQTCQQPDSKALKRALAESLPDYMVPDIYVFLPQLPLTVNGKIDKAKLAPPELGGEPQQYIAPRNDTEVTLCGIFERVLNREKVSIDDDFFELGGHSLLAIRIGSAIRESFGKELPLSKVYEHTTVADLAVLIESLDSNAVMPSIERIERNSETDNEDLEEGEI